MSNTVSKQQLGSLTTLMNKIVDYAGIFPPGNLPLKQAITNYRNYLEGNDVWMLRSFVLPIAKLSELEKYMDLFSTDKKLKLSLVVSKSDSAEDFDGVCQVDTNKAKKFLDEYVDKVSVESLEIPLPQVNITKNMIKNVSHLAERFNTQAFCEMSKPLSDDWIEQMKGAMERINEFNRKNPKSKIGYKLRTGGIKAHLFPSTEQVAYTLTESVERGIPIKFTAGLHHPVRMYRDEVDTKMHGFLNVFMGYIFQASYKWNVEEVKEILKDEDERNFQFSNRELKWKNFNVSINEIKMIRTSLLNSFGSCSFDDPREDLRDLNMMK